MRLPLLFAVIVLSFVRIRAAEIEPINELVSEGHWQQAQQKIEQALAQPELRFQAREDLLFQRDRMTRMSLDFNKTREQVFQEVCATTPSINEKQFADWEKVGALELLNIDGTNRYFLPSGGQFISDQPGSPVA